MINTNIELITPFSANEYLKNNTQNRKININHVRELARAITNNDWELNGVPVIFAENGRLIDGQHRLHAIVWANRPVKMLVIRGVSNSSFDTIDVGMKRTTGQILQMQGIKNANNVSASARLLDAWRKTGRVHRSFSNLTARETERMLNKDSGLIESSNYVYSSGVLKKLISPSHATTFHYVLGLHNANMRDEFFNVLTTGMTDNERYFVVVKLRDWLIINAGARGINVDTKAMYFCKTIKHVVNDTRPKILKVALNGASTDKNPYDMGISREI